MFCCFFPFYPTEFSLVHFFLLWSRTDSLLFCLLLKIWKLPWNCSPVNSPVLINSSKNCPTAYFPCSIWKFRKSLQTTIASSKVFNIFFFLFFPNLMNSFKFTNIGYISGYTLNFLGSLAFCILSSDPTQLQQQGGILIKFLWWWIPAKTSKTIFPPLQRYNYTKKSFSLLRKPNFLYRNVCCFSG